MPCRGRRRSRAGSTARAGPSADAGEPRAGAGDGRPTSRGEESRDGSGPAPGYPLRGLWAQPLRARDVLVRQSLPASMRRHLAIVRAYNEAGAIAAAIEDIRLHAPDFDIVVVDDGSTDDTADRARAAGAKVIQPPFNLGIGGAVQCGY